MNIGVLLPGFSKDESDWAIPIQQNLMRELSKTDDVRVVALRYPFTDRPYRLYGAQIYPLGGGSYVRGGARLMLWWRALRLIARLHYEKPFTILHAMWADETGLIAAWSGRRLDIPVVVSPMGGELVGFGDIDYGLQRSSFSRWTVGQALHGADAITVQGTHTRQRITEAGYIIPNGRIYRVPLGVDTSVFIPDGSSQSKHLIHVGSLVAIKDQATLLRAFAQLAADTTLDIIGEGVLRPALERLAHELEIAQRVRFLGSVHHLDLPQHYRRAMLHIVTSRNETGPLTTVEAAACGVPTVSTDVGLIRDYPALGITVPVGDANALAKAIQDLLENTIRYNHLKQLALEVMHTSLQLQHTVDQFRELYTTLNSTR